MKHTLYKSLSIAIALAMFLMPYAPVNMVAAADEEEVTSISEDSAEVIYEDVEVSIELEELIADTSKDATYANYGSSYFKGAELEIYEALKEDFEKAAEEGGSTIFYVIVEEFEIGDCTRSELSTVANAALEEVCSNTFLGDLISCVLADCPYTLYWYDKTSSTSIEQEAGNCEVGYDSYDGKTYYGAYLKDVEFIFRFPVSKEYQYDSAYYVDPDVAGEASKAACNAYEVVVDCAALSDYEKLVAYKKYICEAVDYSSDYDEYYEEYGYGSPWQLIWVFDEDDSTDVVCEGYSKAFQYLCDLSTFSGEVECYLPTGYMEEEAHMWNIVSIGGSNYLVDVTNSESNTVGKNGELFLVGAESGSVSSGYTFTACNSQYTYAYSSDTVSLYTEAILTLATSDYCDHTYVSEITTEATCTKDGVMTYTCSKCSDTYTEAISATGHSYDEGTVTTEATCSSEGIMTYTCSVCGDTYTGAIEKTAHTEDEAVTENLVAATCEEDGSYDSAVYCSVCGEEISRTTTTVSATGHSYDYSNIAWSWADDYSSATATVTCTNDSTHTYTYTAEVTASADSSTCEKGGEITYTASITITEDTYTDTKVIETEATGHSYDDGVVTTAATCTADGVMTYTCSACGDTYTEAIAATGHSYDSGTVAKEATATEEGIITYTCTVCGDTYTEAIEKLAADDDDSDNDTDDNADTSDMEDDDGDIGNDAEDSVNGTSADDSGSNSDSGDDADDDTDNGVDADNDTDNDADDNDGADDGSDDDSSDDADSNDTPQTGDDTDIYLWILALLAGASIVILINRWPSKEE